MRGVHSAGHGHSTLGHGSWELTAQVSRHRALFTQGTILLQRPVSVILSCAKYYNILNRGNTLQYIFTKSVDHYGAVRKSSLGAGWLRCVGVSV